MSVTTRSISPTCLARVEIASIPSTAARTRYPCRETIVRTMFRMFASSSTTRISSPLPRGAEVGGASSPGVPSETGR